MTWDVESLVALSGSDEASVTLLFEACFFSRPDPHWFTWKYQSDKRFDGIALGMWQKGRLVAHYAGFPRTLVCGEEKLLALQIGDVMVHPNARHGLAKFNRFAKLTKGFFSEKLRNLDTTSDLSAHGESSQVHSTYHVAYGFPNARHLMQGAIQACYRPADLMFEMVWKIDQKENILRNEQGELLVDWVFNETDRPRSALDSGVFNHVALEMIKSFKSKRVWAVPRSLDYWLWRFPTCRSYRWISVKENGDPQSLVAAAVLKPIDAGETYELLDWICRPDMRSDAFDALLKKLKFEGVLTLRTWASESASSYFRSDAIDRIEKLAFQMALSIYPDACAADLVGNNLWMISGDTDFR